MDNDSRIIGREEEIRLLSRAYDSRESEFVAIYGRRRVGKTFLVRKFFNNHFTFQYTGAYNISNKEQLEEFHRSLVDQGFPKEEKVPANWFEAFHMLERLISESKDQRKVIFIDELPWMDAKNSRFLSAFEHFWNGWASARTDIVLIICGSASSWIINRIFRNKGGLYNRVSYKIPLGQFSLYECELLAKELKLPFNRNMIMEGYMIMGGIPYYWTRLDPEKSVGKNVNDLFVKSNGLLRNEFSYLYASMFNRPEKYMKVVEALAGKKSGLTRDEIIAKGKIDSSGQLSDILDDLIECGLIRKYCHLDKKLKDAIYQLVDCYTLFYFQFVRNAHGVDEDYWVKTMATPEYHTWCGLSFERLCLLHTRQMKSALGISGIRANLFSWHVRKTDDHPGVQIDLLIDRADGIINICEMKYSPGGYRLTSAELNKIRSKVGVFNMYMPRSRYAQPVLITSNGVVHNSNSDEIPLKVSGDQLFLP
ncbi:MAG: ATP-binding protein [Muribaculaceae bacterium]|nr:ATP-binding protein [Muribaculaceae bacterium]